MKKHLLALLLMGSWFCGRAQWVSIPDDNFGYWIYTHGYSQCVQGFITLSNWQLDTTCAAVVNTTSIICDGAGIHDLTGIEYFNNLQTLNCGYNQITTLPSLPNGLTRLECNSNHLSTLPNLPNGLAYLDCNYNQITSLPSLPSGLATLVCYNNGLTSLPTLSNGLVHLDCNGNALTSLPVLPSGLAFLTCRSNQIASLPPLPNGLGLLDCFYNIITNLPTLPDSLTVLGCNLNHLTSLPTLPNGLVTLYCESNQLASLPILPNSLSTLYCNSNPLTTLPSLPNSLTSLNCYSTYLTSIPELPDSMFAFDCSHTSISCLPRLKKINQFVFNYTGLTCLPNYPQSNSYSNPSLLSFPVCDMYNIHNCAVYWNIRGNVFFDENNNCNSDSVDTGLSGIKVNLHSNGVVTQQTFTDVNGNYFFDTDTLGTYTITIDTSNIPFAVSCPFSGVNTVTVAIQDSLTIGGDFALLCKQVASFDVGVTSVTAGVHGVELFYGTNNTTSIHLYNQGSLYNVGCDTAVSGSVTLTMTGPITYVSPSNGSSSPDSVNGNIITWNVANFDSFNSGHPLDILVHVDSSAQLGQFACFTIIVAHPVGDNNLANDTLTRCFEIGLPIDPNGKNVYPAGNIDSTQHGLTYTIYFQNTGIAPARNIYIDDTLDTDLDENSFQLLSFSHQPLVQIKESAIRFNYPNINLADSTHNETQSHGYVQYSIKTKTNLTCGTQIGTPAFIYFDFNSPVKTNTPLNAIYSSVTTDLQANICNGENYDFHGVALIASGNYSDTLPAQNVCDSIVTLHLNVWQAPSFNINTSLCDGEAYYVGNHAYNQAGTFNDTLQTVNGCDSIIMLHLNIWQPSTSNINTSVCDGETYSVGNHVYNQVGIFIDTLQTINGCNSVVTLNLTVYPKDSSSSTQAICNGDSYDFYGASLNSAGNYTHVFQNVHGCDSVIALELIVHAKDSTSTCKHP